MLTEVSRTPFTVWHHARPLVEPWAYFNRPTLATIGDALCVADLRTDTYSWTGVRLFLGDGRTFVYEFAEPEMEYVGHNLWLYEDAGTLVAAVLVKTPAEANLLLALFRIDPETGDFLEETWIPTSVEPVSFTPNGFMPSIVEETDAGLSLRVRLHLPSGSPGANGEFQALRAPGGEWTITCEIESYDGADMYLPVTAHGWTLDLAAPPDNDQVVALSDADGTVVVPAPEGYSNYFGVVTRAALDRRHPGEASFLLSTGEDRRPDGNTYIAYDVCLYGGDPPPQPDTPNSWWEGELQDDNWHPDWGSGTLTPGIIPSLPGNGTVVLTNPADPDNPWAWATLPPGAGLNDWMQFYVDRDWVQVIYGGRVVLAWRMPPAVYQHFLTGGASMGFYNSITKQWQAEPPPGWPPAKPAPLNGWAYLVDSRHRVSETGDRLTRYGTRIDADDVLVFPGDYALVGQALQDDVIQSAPIKHIAGRDLSPVVLIRDDALLVWDAGYGHYLYPVEAQ